MSIKKIITILIGVIIILLISFSFREKKESNDFKVSLSVNRNNKLEIYNVNVKISNKNTTINEFKNNFIVSYALNGDKYEILNDGSERVNIRDKQTNKILQTYYFGGGSKNGSYINLTDDLKQIICNDKYILELSYKIKIKDNCVQDVDRDKIIVNITPYKNKISNINIFNQYMQVSSDINYNSKELTYSFNIPNFDSIKPLNK